MNYKSDDYKQIRDDLKPGSLMSLTDYLASDNISTNPYALIDDFLDETWNFSGSSLSSSTTFFSKELAH